MGTQNRTRIAAAVIMLALAGGAQADAAVIYDNGGLGAAPATESGVSAPAGTSWSETKHPTADLTQANETRGLASSGGLASRMTSPFRRARAGPSKAST